jgi:hypothetical protein
MILEFFSNNSVKREWFLPKFALQLSALKQLTFSKDKFKLSKVFSIDLNIPVGVSSGFSIKLIILFSIPFAVSKYCTVIGKNFRFFTLDASI